MYFQFLFVGFISTDTAIPISFDKFCYFLLLLLINLKQRQKKQGDEAEKKWRNFENVSVGISKLFS